MSEHEAFKWDEQSGVCLNPVKYRWQHGNLRGTVAVAKSGFWYASWLVVKRINGVQMWSQGPGYISGGVYQRGSRYADEAGAVAGGLEAMMAMMGQGEQATPETRRFSDWICGEYEKFRRTGTLPEATQKTVDIGKTPMHQEIEKQGTLRREDAMPVLRSNSATEDGEGGQSTTTPAQTALAVVDTGELFVSATKRGEDFSNGSGCFLTVRQQYTCQDLEKAYRELTAQEGFHHKAEAMKALQAGVVAHMHKIKSGLSDARWWSDVQVNLGESRSTVSRKMRLAVDFARAKGASDEHILSLAQAADLTDHSSPVLQLAFDFIGNDSLSDLYRRHNIAGPKPRGGAVTPKDPATGKLERAPRRTLEQIAQSEFEAQALAWVAKALEVGQQGVAVEFKGAHLWDTMPDDELEWLRGYLADIKDGIVASLGRRKAAGRGRGQRGGGKGQMSEG